jgi:hypothetical protein
VLQLLCHVDVFRDGFPRKSTTCREFPLCIVFRDGKHAIPRWGLKKTRPRYIVGSVKKKHAVPSVVCIILKITAFFIITLLARLYGRIVILLICGNNLHNGIISPRGETWAHTTRHQEGRIGPIQLGTKRGGLGPYN